MLSAFQFIFPETAKKSVVLIVKLRLKRQTGNRSLSLRTEKDVCTTACLLAMFIFCHPLCHQFYTLIVFVFLGHLLPSMSISLLLPPRVYLFMTSRCFSSPPELAFHRSLKRIFTRASCCFPWWNFGTRLRQTCSNASGQDSFYDSGIWSRSYASVVACFCVWECQSAHRDKDAAGGPAETWASSIHVHRFASPPPKPWNSALNRKSVCASVCVHCCIVIRLDFSAPIPPHPGRSVWRVYLVGATGGVESVGSTNKQRIFILLQQHFDEIVTLVLQRQRKWKPWGFDSFNYFGFLIACVCFQEAFFFFCPFVPQTNRGDAIGHLQTCL